MSDTPPVVVPRRRHPALRVLIGLLASLLGLLLLVLLLLSLLLFHEPTNRALLGQLNRWLPQLELVGLRGALGDGLYIEALRWTSDSLRLELTDVESQWRLQCLRRGAFCIDFLRADQALLWTAPADPTAEPEPDEPFSGLQLPAFKLPWQVELAELRVDRISWQSGAEEPLELGQAMLEGVVAGHDLALHQVRWSFDNSSFGQGDLELAGHLATQGDYPVQAELQGRYRPAGVEQPFEQWQLRLDGDLSQLALDLMAAGQGAVRLQGQVDLTQARLPLRLELTTEAPVQWRDIRIDTTKLALEGDLEGYQVKAETRLQLPDQPLLRLSLVGRGDLEQLELAPLQAQVGDGRVAMQGQLSWTDGVRWNGVVDLSRFDPASWVPELPGRLDGRADTTFALVDDQWSLDLANLRVSGGLRDQPVQLQGGLAHSPAGHWLLRDLALHWGANQVLARGRVSDTWSLSGSLQLPELAAFWPDLAGALEGTWQVRGPRDDPRAQVQATSPLLAFGEQRLETLNLRADLSPLTLNPVELDLAAVGGRLGGEQLHNLQLRTRGTAAAHQLQLEGVYQDYQLSMGAEGAFDRQAQRWQGLVRDLQWASVATETTPDWRMVQQTPSALSWQGDGQQLTLAPVCLADEVARLCAGVEFEGDAERLALTTDIEQFPLARIRRLLTAFTDLAGKVSSRGELLMEQGEVQRATLEGGLEGVAVSRIGERQLATPFTLSETSWQLAYGDDQLMGSLHYLRGEEAGQVTGQVRDLRHEPNLDVKLALQDLNLAEVAALAGLPLDLRGSLGADLHLSGTPQAPQINGDLQAQNVSLRSAEQGQPWVRNLNLEAEFAGQAADLSLRLTAPEYLDWAPVAPARVSWQGIEQLMVVPSCWTAQDNRLCLEGQWQAGEALQARVKLDGQTASLLAPLLPEGLALESVVQVEAELSQAVGQPPALTLGAQLQSGRVLLSQDQEPPLELVFESLALDARLADHQTQGQLRLVSEQMGRGDADFELASEPGAPVRARWNLQGLELALARPFLPQLSELGGRLGLQGELGGTLDAPSVSGVLQVQDGHFASPTIPVGMDDLDVDIQLDQNQASLTGTFASGKGRGELSGEGLIAPQWSASIRLQGTNIPVVRAPEIDLVVQPDLTLKAEPGLIFLGGRLEVSRGLLEFKPLPGSAVEVSSDVVFIDERETLDMNETSWDFRSNLKLVVSERVQLKGFGAEIRMNGGVDLIQDDRDVLIGRGTLNILEGRYERFGQRLKIRSGQILFNGPLARPFVNIEAVREAGDVVAGIRLSGSITEPTITLFSEPSLPEDTIMHYLLTGNAPGAGVGDQSALANRALLGLGLYGGTPLAEEFAEKFGVEEFDISTSGEGDRTAVNVSGYLSPRLFVQYGISVFSPENTLTLRYQLRPKLFLEAINGVENILDLLYTFEF